MLASAITAEREFAFTKAEFERIATILRRETGIALSERKSDLVYTRLSKRLRQLNLSSFAAYLDLLERDSGELTQLVNRLTTNLTRFYREPHHFHDLAGLVAARAKDGARKIRIWSAGCSSGQEAYSAAAAALEGAGPNRLDLKVLATDIDTEVLAKARAGRYPAEDIAEAPPTLTKWFSLEDGVAQVGPALQSLVSFKQLNLIGPWPMRGPFDAIFCRNVAIYFEAPVQDELFARMARLLAPQGRLYLGHSESLRLACGLAPAGTTTYVRTADPEPSA